MTNPIFTLPASFIAVIVAAIGINVMLAMVLCFILFSICKWPITKLLNYLKETRSKKCNNI